MKKTNQLKYVFQKAKILWGGAYKNRIVLNQKKSSRETGIVTNSIKTLEVSFGKSIRDHSKWDKIIEGQQKTHAWNRVRLSFRGKSMIRNKSLFPSCNTQSKFIVFQNIKKEIEKRIYDFLWNRKKYYQFVRSHQCSLEISHVALTEINLEF